MAINFELWVECRDEQSISFLAHHFQGIEYHLSTGRNITTLVEVVNKPLGIFGVRVSPVGLSRSGVRTLQDALETTEVGLQLYYRLKSASDFRYARVGWESENIMMIDLSEWVENLHNGDKRLEIECVIDNALYEQLGKPKNCYSFRDGYWWTRYSGATYKPLWSSDQKTLTEFHRKLFPEHFSY